jgi:predicted TIM-barrel fold metal-dependent hydrolase
MPAIDVHTHPILRHDERGRAGAAQLIGRAKAHGIEHIVVLGDVIAFGRSPNEAQLRIINDETYWLMQRYPGYVTGFCHVNPTLGERAVTKEVERCADFAASNLRSRTTPATPPCGPSWSRPKSIISSYSSTRGA